MIFEDLHDRAQEDSFECSVCGAKAPSDEGLQLHKEIEHRLRFKCITCNAAFATRNELLDHIENCPELNESEIDEEEFRQNIERQSTLTKHLRIVFVGEVFF